MRSGARKHVSQRARAEGGAQLIFFRVGPFPGFREDDHEKLFSQVNVWQGALKKIPRVFCGIYTHQTNHATKVKVRTRPQAIKFADERMVGDFRVSNEYQARTAEMSSRFSMSGDPCATLAQQLHVRGGLKYVNSHN